MRALFQIALEGSSSPVNVRALAKSQGIPIRFLEVILNELKQGGFLISIRGRHGGYRLARKPDQITIGQIIRFLDQSTPKTESNNEPLHPGQWTFQQLLDTINQQISALCDHTTLEQLVTDYQKHHQPFVPNYII